MVRVGRFTTYLISSDCLRMKKKIELNIIYLHERSETLAVLALGGPMTSRQLQATGGFIWLVADYCSAPNGKLLLSNCLCCNYVITNDCAILKIGTTKVLLLLTIEVLISFLKSLFIMEI